MKRTTTTTTPNPSTPGATLFTRLCTTAEEGGQFAVAQLARHSDRLGMTPAGLARFPHLLDEAELDPADVTEHVITRADLLLRHWDEGLKAKLARHNSRFQEEPKAPPEPPRSATVAPGPAKAPTAPKPPKSEKPRLLGYRLTAVLRWMGVEGWERVEVELLLAYYKLDPSPNTVSAQLRDGRSGKLEFGPVAPLTDEEQNTLYDVLHLCKERLRKAEKTGGKSKSR